jgi:hypothetical protein
VEREKIDLALEYGLFMVRFVVYCCKTGGEMIDLALKYVDRL